MTFNGSATAQAGYCFKGQGGLVFSGQAVLSTFYPTTGGVIVFAGQATEQASYVFNGSGAIFFRPVPVHGIGGKVASCPRFSGKVKTFPGLQGTITTSPRIKGKVACNRRSPALCEELELVH